MFGVKHNECVGFDSRWSVKKVYYEGSTQTPLYVSKDGTTNTVDNKEIEVQTDPPEALKNVDFDVDRLAGFLTKMYPRVKRELDDSHSIAFDNYTLQGELCDTSIKLLQSVEVIPQDKSSMEAANIAKLSSFSWNCSSKTIAVSLSYSHQAWCYDPGLVLLYTFDKEDRLPISPTKKINCDSCVSQVQFHPSVASILAGITHSSAIFLWNIHNREDETVLIKVSRTDNLSCLNWMTLDYVTLDIVFLVTAGLDGTITLWRFNNSYSCANVYNRYRIKPPLIAKSKVTKSKNDAKTSDHGVGITCFDFSKHLPDMFVVGTEGGLIIQCSTSKPNKIKGGTEIDPLYDPVYQYYNPHESSVISVQFSKVKKDVFLTSGSDRQIRIYVIDQEDPARVIFDNYSLDILYWVPNEKQFVFGYGGNSKIHVFNVITGKILKIGDDEDEVKTSQLNATCLVNPHRSNIVAVGLKKGILELWSVPWSTFSQMNS
ncbi:cytoplasmic dynein 2 intermediate chain 2-like [Coccinella septempunctata]|uniref:cytoplasmic dynein 2 intermediate chain 2-like n=1 Tax=Coccinella septempunctata TaxID=41139 RepID=UPI001D06EF66|nr:cytoplasmic dynein 2 intermediate chain 2-like [Coccinella septempunctata]